MKLNNLLEDLKFDVRLVNKATLNNTVTAKEYKEYLESLEDLSDQKSSIIDMDKIEKENITEETETPKAE